MNKNEAIIRNRQEQNRIKTAVVNAIPAGVYYHNIVAALSTMLNEYTLRMVEDDMKKWDGPDKPLFPSH